MKWRKGYIQLVILAAMGGITAWIVGNYETLIPYHWQRYATDDGRVSLEFPGKPVMQDRRGLIVANGTTTLHMVDTQTADHSDYAFAYSDAQESGGKTMGDLLNSARDSGIANIEGKLITEKHITVQGHEGRDILAHGRSSIVLDIRLIAVKDQIYALEVVSSNEQARDNKNIQRFFDSFRLNSP
jgi:hypothetical protein